LRTQQKSFFPERRSKKERTIAERPNEDDDRIGRTVSTTTIPGMDRRRNVSSVDGQFRFCAIIAGTAATTVFY
jgi:hypothetical protein